MTPTKIKRKLIELCDKLGHQTECYIFHDKWVDDEPVKFSKDWFDNIHEYHKGNPDYEYVLCFDEKHKQVKVNIVKDGTRYIKKDKVKDVLLSFRRTLLKTVSECGGDG